MVNCKNCGAPLTLEDAVCPHCGTPNPEAQEHLKKLAQLDKEFKKTRKEVVQEVSKTKKGYALLIILVMLLLANFGLFIVHAASYEIAESITAKSVDLDVIKVGAFHSLDLNIIKQCFLRRTDIPGLHELQYCQKHDDGLHAPLLIRKKLPEGKRTVLFRVSRQFFRGIRKAYRFLSDFFKIGALLFLPLGIPPQYIQKYVVQP